MNLREIKGLEIKVLIVGFIVLVVFIFTGCGEDNELDVTGINDATNQEHNSTEIDTTSSIITINGDKNITIRQFTEYKELGATIRDEDDKNLSIIINGEVDELVAGTYEIIYTAMHNQSEIAKVTRIVNVEAPNYVEEREAFSSILDDRQYTTLEEWKKTGYYKLRRNMTEEDKGRESRFTNFYKSIYRGKTIDKMWERTDINLSTIYRKPGEKFEVGVNKVDSNGEIYAPVDNEMLRLVVRIQKIDNTFEYIEDNEIENYVKWLQEGVLEIRIPDDMTSGTLLVGIRPKQLDREGKETTALSERWSALIVADIPEVKTGTIKLSPPDVLFPSKKTSTQSIEEFFKGTKFSKDELMQIGEKYAPCRPMILQNTTVQKGDFVAYEYKNMLYSGKVLEEKKNGDEQLVFLDFNLSSVYNITNRTISEKDLMVKHGLIAEFRPLSFPSEKIDENEEKRLKKR